MDEMLEGIEGVTVIMDHILIAGSNTEHHDAVLRTVTESVTSYNLKLNLQKCIIRRPIHRTPPDICRSEAEPIEGSSCPCYPHPKEQRRCQTISRIVTYLANFIFTLVSQLKKRLSLN